MLLWHLYAIEKEEKKKKNKNKKQKHVVTRSSIPDAINMLYIAHLFHANFTIARPVNDIISPAVSNTRTSFLPFSSA